MTPKKVCPAEHCPNLIPRTTRYCPTHTREYDRKRGTRQQRGYDNNHDRLRATWQARLDQGERINCATCGKPINPKSWDLGHSTDRRSYIGPQCRKCNRGHAEKKQRD